MKIQFKERQKFTQLWLWVILIIVSILPLMLIYKQLILGEKLGNKPMPDIAVVVFSIFIFALVCFFGLMQLKTEIDNEEIRITYYPIMKKKIAWKEIKKAEVVNYGFSGGWGIRFSAQYGTIFNIKGNSGLAIELKSGKKILIGTQKENEIQRILDIRAISTE